MTTDDGGGNSGRCLLRWLALQQLPAEKGLLIIVFRYHPARSKKRKMMQHRLCRITKNWRGVMLPGLLIIVTVITNTTTKKAWLIFCGVDDRTNYKSGQVGVRGGAGQNVNNPGCDPARRNKISRRKNTIGRDCLGVALAPVPTARARMRPIRPACPDRRFRPGVPPWRADPLLSGPRRGRALDRPRADRALPRPCRALCRRRSRFDADAGAHSHRQARRPDCDVAQRHDAGRARRHRGLRGRDLLHE